VGETFNRFADLQILGCELHKNAFGDRAPPGPAGGRYSAPPAVISGGEEGNGKERVGNGEWRKEMGGKGVKG